jgi:hypothetical protein
MQKNLHELIQDYYGVKTTYSVDPLTDTVLTTATPILSGNQNRLGLLICNTGNNNIYVSPKTDVSVGHGILLVAASGILTMKWRDDFTLLSLPYYAIADGGNSTAFVFEVVTT